MRDLRTSGAGILAGLALAAKAVFPEYGTLADLATALFLAILGVFAQDAKTK